MCTVPETLYVFLRTFLEEMSLPRSQNLPPNLLLQSCLCSLKAVDFENMYNDVREETVFGHFIKVVHAEDLMTA